MKVAVILANGFEEIEALSVVDILRRGDVECVIVGLDRTLICGAHEICVQSDILLDELDETQFDAIVLPGGLLGAKNLAKSAKLTQILHKFDENNKFICAICAAPVVLAKAQVLKQNFTCYPSFEKEIEISTFIPNQNVVKDHNIITSKGPATAMEFGLEILRELQGEKIYKDIKNGLLF